MKTKFRRLVYMSLIGILLTACGAMTIRIDTEVNDETDITHDLGLEASGHIGTLIAAEFDSNGFDSEEMRKKCSSSIESDEVEIKCSNLTQEELSEGDINDQSLPINVTKEDLGDEWEYRAIMVNDFSEGEELSDPMLEGMDLDSIIRFRFHWSVKMPGEIVETNADITEDNKASFTVKLDDERERLVVVSRQKKSTGLFGACN